MINCIKNMKKLKKEVDNHDYSGKNDLGEGFDLLNPQTE